VEDGASPLDVAITDDMVVVVEIDVASEAAAVAEPLPPFSDPVKLPDEEVERSPVVDGGAVGLGVDDIEVLVVVDGRVVDPPVANSLATARFRQKQAMRMAKAFELIEHTMAVARFPGAVRNGGSMRR
jgi:hypothetical protein